MIHAMTPFRADKNLGRAYNEAMALIPAGDWAVFLDHDMMFTTPRWHAQFLECTAFLPEAGAFVAMTNRIASPWQRTGDPVGNDVAAHRAHGHARLAVRTLLDITVTKGWGGVCFAVSRAAWEAAGGFADGLGCVDHSFHFRARAKGYRMWLVEGLYVYHWRHQGEPDPTSHAPKAADCPCRGPEVAPTERVALP